MSPEPPLAVALLASRTLPILGNTKVELLITAEESRIQHRVVLYVILV